MSNIYAGNPCKPSSLMKPSSEPGSSVTYFFWTLECLQCYSATKSNKLNTALVPNRNKSQMFISSDKKDKYPRLYKIKIQLHI